MCPITALAQGTNMELTENNDTANQWTNPVTDDDEDQPFCTPSTNSSFACSQIRCVHQRPLDTGDAQDFQFTTNDKMKIAAGRAFLGIATVGSTTQKKMAVGVADKLTAAELSGFTLTIAAGAVSSVASSAVAVSALLLAAAF